MLKNKTLVISGASSGLGKALSIKAVELGAFVSICARNEDEIFSIAQTINGCYGQRRVLAIKADVSNKEEVLEVIKQTKSVFGRIDAVIANAGMSMWSRFADVADPDEFFKLININYMGVLNFLFYSLPDLQKNKGSFVAISSIQGVLPVPYHAGYVASKYAVNGLIETVRLEEKDVHFLLAMPSWIAGTHLRANALVGHGEQAIKVNEHHSKNVMNVDFVAKEILHALIKKKNTLFLPKKYCLVPVLRYFFKSLTDKIIRYKVEKQIKF